MSLIPVLSSLRMAVIVRLHHRVISVSPRLRAILKITSRTVIVMLREGMVAVDNTFVCI
jgi:hypothetical protein